MTVLLQHLWPALAVAGALGLCFSLAFGSGAGLPSARHDVRLGAILLLLVGLLLSVLEIVPGRPGLWLDIGVFCAAAYGGGVAIGAVLRMLFIRPLPKGPVPIPSDPAAGRG